MKNFRFHVGVLLVVAVLAVVGCSSEKPDAMLASAKLYLAKNDAKAAVIQIKNVLQKDPEHAEARFLLGQVLLAGRDPVAAEVEFDKALVLKYPADQAVPPLARAMLAQGKARQLVEKHGKTALGDAEARADLFTSLAAAHAMQNDQAAALAALAKALEAKPDFVPAVLVQVRQKAATRDFAGAHAQLDRLLQGAPNDGDALKLKGDLLAAEKSDPTAAMEAYRKAVAARADNLPARFAMISLLLRQGKLEDATQQLVQAKQVGGSGPDSVYYEAQIAFQGKNHKRARELSQQLLKVASNNPRALQLAGAVELQHNAMPQAAAYFSKALQLDPELSVARRLLVATYLRTGQPARALAALPRDIAQQATDADMLSLAGQAYLQTGDAKTAQELFVKAAKLDPKDARKRTEVALGRMRAGSVDAAFDELQDIAASDAGMTADMAIISANMQLRNFEKALKAVDGLEKKLPGKPMPSQLRGQVYLAKRDPAAARQSFDRALAIESTYFPAISALAALDMAEKKPDAARKRFDDLLAKEPTNAQALLALAELRARAGAPKEELAGLIGKAVAANPTEPAPRLLLIDFHMRNQDAKQALSAAQTAVSALPQNPELLDALGRAQLASNDFNQALATFNKLAGLQPASPQPHLRLAAVHLAEKKLDAAAQSLRKALEIQPDSLEAQRMLVALAAQVQNFTEAVAVARTVQKQRPKEPIGYVLEGDISVAQKKWEAAAEAYRAGVKQAASPELGIKLHTVMLAGGKVTDAEKFAAGWTKERPRDAAFVFHLGDSALGRKDYALAEKHYQAVVQIQPNNPAALNNLAWLAVQSKKDTAFSLAEKANRLAPNQPAFMDTMALALAAKKEFTAALDWQTRAIKLQPDNSALKLNLARIQIDAGNKDAAKKGLNELAALGDKFGGQAEVARLLKAL